MSCELIRAARSAPALGERPAALRSRSKCNRSLGVWFSVRMGPRARARHVGSNRGASLQGSLPQARGAVKPDFRQVRAGPCVSDFSKRARRGGIPGRCANTRWRVSFTLAHDYYLPQHETAVTDPNQPDSSSTGRPPDEPSQPYISSRLPEQLMESD